MRGNVPHMSMSDGAGRVLLNGRYELRGVAGSGGMATVWRAWDTVLSRDVAIKILKGEIFHDWSRRQLRNEAQAAARLVHPHVAAVYDFNEEHDGPDAGCFVVMEFVEGRTVDEVMHAERLDWLRATTIAAQAASALAYAHRRGVVHRDVSGANLMLTDDGAKILDFGIAATPEHHASHPNGELLGTPAYVAPERLRESGARAGPAADVYALGVVWYRMLTGDMPWAARSNTALLQAHLVYTPAPLPAIAGMPDELRELCLACLAKNPADRPESAHLAARLAAYAAGTGTQPDQVTTVVLAPRPSRRRRIVLAGAGLLAVVAWTAGTVIYADSRGERMPGVATLPTDVPAPPSPSPTTGPAPTPTITPNGLTVTARPAPVTAAPPAGTVITSVGGSVRVVCQGPRATVVSLAPAPGFDIKDHDPGPAPETQTVLASADHESEIKARCARGVATGRVKETTH